ncbi:MAG: ceramide glucosyltransferase [Qingshengfaniella sp.]
MSILAIAGFAALTGLQGATAALAAWRLRPARSVGPVERPFVTLLRPARGLDPFDLETLESSFDLDWPAYEIIFCVADPRDPACAALEGMIARHPERQARLMIGEDQVTANPKLNNLAKGWAAARGAEVVMADANLLLPPDYLQRLFEVRDAGCTVVTSPAAGTRPSNFWGAVECAFLNGFQGRWQLAADSVGQGFTQGKTVMVRKDWLEAGGGLVALGRNLAEDVALTKLVRTRGGRVRLTRQMFAQPVGRRTARAVWDRQVRWSRVRRDGFAGLFALEILQGILPPALLLLIFAPPIWLVPLAMVWFGIEWALARVSGWPHGPRDLAAMVLRDLMLPVLWGATFARRGFDWRGNAMGAAHDPA